MSKMLTVTIADSVYDEIELILKTKNKTNRSEFVEEMLRLGLDEYKTKEDDTNERNKEEHIPTE